MRTLHNVWSSHVRINEIRIEIWKLKENKNKMFWQLNECDIQLEIMIWLKLDERQFDTLPIRVQPYHRIPSIESEFSFIFYRTMEYKRRQWMFHDIWL